MARRKWLYQSGAWGLIGFLLLLTGLNVWRATNRLRTITQPDSQVEDWEVYVSMGQRIGLADAPLSIVAFSDYQCQVCKAFDDQIRVLQARYKDSVTVILRHLPLPTSRHAVPAARSAVCAERAGRFIELHRLIFSLQDSLGAIPWATLASRAGVPDTNAFHLCLADEATLARLYSDRAAAEELGASVTPTLIIGNRLYRGLPQDLDRIVARAMKDVRTGRWPVTVVRVGRESE